MCRNNYYEQSHQSSKSTSRARRSDRDRNPELVTFPELWGTFMSEADVRQMDQWRRETEEMLTGTPSYTRGQSVRDNSQASSSSSSRKRSHEDDNCRSPQPAKRQRRSVSRDRGATSRDNVSRERAYDARRPRTTVSQGRQHYDYRSASVSSRYYRPSARVFVNRDHYRFSHWYRQ